MVMGSYDVAQVCQNGHTVNDSYHRFPQHNQPFCSRCGAASITACESCRTPIRGEYDADGVIAIGFTYKPPAYCHNCGQPYPWTGAALQSARDLADELDGLDEQEREALKGTLDDLVRDSARTQVASLRFEKLAAKTGKEGAGMLRDVLVGVVSEAARKVIWGP
jgi:hypothetical protein